MAKKKKTVEKNIDEEIEELIDQSVEIIESNKSKFEISDEKDEIDNCLEKDDESADKITMLVSEFLSKNNIKMKTDLAKPMVFAVIEAIYMWIDTAFKALWLPALILKTFKDNAYELRVSKEGNGRKQLVECVKAILGAEQKREESNNVNLINRP